MVCIYRYEVGWVENQASQKWFLYKDMRHEMGGKSGQPGIVCIYRYEVGWAENQVSQEWFVYKDMRWDG